MNCIHCNEIIDEDRLWFLNLKNRPLTCQNCSMEKPAVGYKDKPKIVKSRTNAQIRKSAEKYELMQEESRAVSRRIWKNINKKRKSRR